MLSIRDREHNVRLWALDWVGVLMNRSHQMDTDPMSLCDILVHVEDSGHEMLYTLVMESIV